MTGCIIKYPVHTFDNILLLPAGTELTFSVMKEIRISGANNHFLRVRLADFGTMKKDILDFMSEPPYDVIFSDRDRIHLVIGAMDSSKLIEPVLQSMEYFKNNDFYTYRHILMVFASSILLSRELIKDHLDLTAGAMASPAHDFGKICIPPDILNKSSLLTQTERKIIEHHALAGYVLLQYYMHDEDGLVSRVARDHHERRNGSGYPRGARLQDPLIEIVVVTDIYDALISPRPYRPISYDNRSALEEISAKAKRGELDWNVVKALVSCNRKAKQHYSQCEISQEIRGQSPAGNTYGLIEKEDEKLK